MSTRPIWTGRLFDLLASFPRPAVDHRFHDEAIARAYAVLADLPYGQAWSRALTPADRRAFRRFAADAAAYAARLPIDAHPTELRGARIFARSARWRLFPEAGLDGFLSSAALLQMERSRKADSLERRWPPPENRASIRIERAVNSVRQRPAIYRGRIDGVLFGYLRGHVPEGLEDHSRTCTPLLQALGARGHSCEAVATIQSGFRLPLFRVCGGYRGDGFSRGSGG